MNASRRLKTILEGRRQAFPKNTGPDYDYDDDYDEGTLIITRTVTVALDHLVLQVLNPKVPSQSRNAEVKPP